MPQQAWNKKRERQYQHIKEGLRERGETEDVAEEIAARTVNKERARSGEARTASRSSTDDISSGRRGGLRSHRGSGGRTKDQLYNEAKHRNIKGRSRMTKAELRARRREVAACVHRGRLSCPDPARRPQMNADLRREIYNKSRPESRIPAILVAKVTARGRSGRQTGAPRTRNLRQQTSVDEVH